ncbi:MAG: ribosome biogenesis GTPase Der [candidate division WOR-3 bacterium]
MTVVIVGRPNTGKSTLFNRLVGGRIAITLREPGVTRDRLVREASWRGRRFAVIDTGGLVPDSDLELEQEIARQVAIALGKADVVVMVVDGTTGLLPLDEEIAARLRQDGRGFLLAVNKCDRKRSYDVAEFYKLGADQVFPISAEKGTGCDELLDEIIARMPVGSSDSSVSESLPCLAILGRPNVGKSTFLNQLLGEERAIVLPAPGTTRDAVEERFQFEGRYFSIVDTAGLRRRSRVKEPVEFYSVSRALDVIDRCDVALVMVDATEGPTAQDQRLLRLLEERGKGMVVVANKRDLVPKELLKDVEQFVTRRLRFVGYVPVVWTSALKGEGVLETVRQAAAVYDCGGVRLSAKVLQSAVLERLKAAGLKFHLRVLGIRQVGIRPPVFRLRLTRPEEVPQAYQRQVMNIIREHFRFAGNPLRLLITR